MTPRGLKDPAEVEKAVAAVEGEAQERQRIPDPYLPAVGPDHPDADLLALEAELHRRREESLRIDRSQTPAFERRKATGDNTEIDAIGDHLSAANKLVHETEDRIAATPANTVAGVAIKLRLAAVHMTPIDRPLEDEDLETRLVVTAHDDIERLAEGGAS